jgi:hypothetical protein
MDDDVEVLQGGVGNAGAVVRVGTHVLRPPSPHRRGIHALLDHLHSSGFDAVPEVVGVEPDGRERLVFIPGDVPIPPFPDWSTTDVVLASTASLLRRFHHAVESFEPPPTATWNSELADPHPGPSPVLCHNDVCPENVVFRDGAAIALLDFEFVAPGRPVWDLAALAMMCIPLDTPEDAARTGRGHLDPVRRLRVVTDAYGLDVAGRHELLETLDERMADGGTFVRRRVEAGEAAFVAMWEAMGGQARYDRRRDWFTASRPTFEAALAGYEDPPGRKP